MLLPYLHQTVAEGTVHRGELSVSYQENADTLVLVSNSEEIATDQQITDGLIAHCNERGIAVGFTLERAAELLLPHLETWRPWTDEEMAQIQKQMADHDAAMRERMAPGS